MRPIIIYCYDAYCQWCYGFSPVIKRLQETFDAAFDFEVLSGGLILPPAPTHISAMAEYLLKTSEEAEAATGISFGKDFLWHLKNPDLSDWYPNSTKPAIALCVFKEYLPMQQVQFATDLGYALHAEGRDLCDDEAYRHLLEKYEIPAEEFYRRLHMQPYADEAREEFETVKQLGVSGYPSMLVQLSAAKIIHLSSGYQSFDVVEKAILQRIQKS